jgi:hypothetical protein
MQFIPPTPVSCGFGRREWSPAGQFLSCPGRQRDRLLQQAVSVSIRVHPRFNSFPLLPWWISAFCFPNFNFYFVISAFD